MAARLQAHNGAAAQENSGRLAQVLAFFRTGGVDQYLRRTSLCLQITGLATQITAQNDKPGTDPLLVRLCQGEVVQKAQARMTHILSQLWRDPEIVVGACVSAMLLTMCDIVLRFAMYSAYPYKLCYLCARFNANYLVACIQFLQEPFEVLDLGLSWPLQELAKSHGPELSQIKFLTSPLVQIALCYVFVGGSGSSLNVERKHVETKRNEASRLSHTAVASRNQILRWFHRQIQQLGASIQRALKEHQRAMKTNVWSLAWQRRGDLRPQALGCVAASLGGSSGPEALTKQGDRAAMRRYDEDHKAELTAEVAAKRAAAKAAVEQTKQAMPITSGEWLGWMRVNESQFRARMATATKERRSRSRRLQARDGLPQPVRRIQPGRRRWTPPVGWAKSLWGREGWHGLRTPGGMAVLFSGPPPRADVLY